MHCVSKKPGQSKKNEILKKSLIIVIDLTLDFSSTLILTDALGCIGSEKKKGEESTKVKQINKQTNRKAN